MPPVQTVESEWGPMGTTRNTEAPASAGHRHAAKVRRWRAPGLQLLIQRATPFTGAVMVTTEDMILETVTVLSEARQLVKAFRREAGDDQPLSPRQWKKARRQLRRDGLL